MPARAGVAARRPLLPAPCPRWRVHALPAPPPTAHRCPLAPCTALLRAFSSERPGRLGHSLLQHARDRPGGRTRRIDEGRPTLPLPRRQLQKALLNPNTLWVCAYYIMLCYPYVMFGFIVERVTVYVCYVRNLRRPITRLTCAQLEAGTVPFLCSVLAPYTDTKRLRARQWCSCLSSAPFWRSSQLFAATSAFGRLCSPVGVARLCNARRMAG